MERMPPYADRPEETSRCRDALRGARPFNLRGAPHGVRRQTCRGACRRTRLKAGLGSLLLLAVACLAVTPGPARAGSVFSREAFGEWIEGYDLRGEALGGTGIGVIDPHNQTRVNPASSAFTRSTLGYVGFGTAIAWTTDGVDTARHPSAFVTGLGIHIALPVELGVRLSAGPATNGSYVLEEALGVEDPEVADAVRREEGSRGLLRYQAALTWRGGPGWAVALGGGMIAGSLLDKTLYDFTGEANEAGWADGEDRRVLRLRPAPFASAGILARPVGPITLGAFLQTAASAEVTRKYTSFGGTEWGGDTTDVELPFGAGGGIGLQLAPRLRLSADLIWREWEEMTADGAALPQPGLGPFRNTLRWGVGLEWLPSRDRYARLLSTFAWRVGFARVPWYLEDADGDPIEEWRVSGGVGIPIQGDRGMLDLLVVWGRRGSQEKNGIDEEFLRFGFSATFARVLREY